MLVGAVVAAWPGLCVGRRPSHCPQREVRIYTLDHPPPHVQVARAGAIVNVDLAPPFTQLRSLGDLRSRPPALRTTLACCGNYVSDV